MVNEGVLSEVTLSVVDAPLSDPVSKSIVGAVGAVVSMLTPDRAASRSRSFPALSVTVYSYWTPSVSSTPAGTVKVNILVAVSYESSLSEVS